MLSKIASTLQHPPKLYDPTVATMRGWMKKFSEVWAKDGFGAAYNKLRMENVMRSGTLVGVDANGNKFYENKSAPYGRTRWVEYPTPSGVWAIEDKYDASMISPEWHGWIHYMHDKPGYTTIPAHDKPFTQPHAINQTMLRPEYGYENATHKPPGSYRQDKPRGRVGPKYQAWTGAPDQSLKNFADNSKTLDIP